MKIIFLNSWYAKAGSVYFDFIKKQSNDTDIFGLSEIHPELFSKLCQILPDFDGLYQKGVYDSHLNYVYGQAFFTKKGIKTTFLKKIKAPFDIRDLYNFGFSAFFKLNVEDKVLYVANVHGKSEPGSKFDTPARIKQSSQIINFLKDKKAPRIIGGDFNLKPDTKSVAMFESAGYKNLIAEFGIKTTRNKLSWAQFGKIEKQYFADYVFVSPEVNVVDFEVPQNEISDHLPLILNFEL